MLRVVFTCKRCLCEIEFKKQEVDKLLETTIEVHRVQTNCERALGTAEVYWGDRKITDFQINTYH